MSENRHVTLSELQKRIKTVLCGEFVAPVWIIAEIGEMKVNVRSGHCYLQLVEKGGANGVPQAQASAVIWAGQYGMLSSYFFGATGEELKAGMKVLLNVAVTYHELYGLSLRVVDIDPLYTLGDLEQQRLMTIAQLKDDGVFDFNRELYFPDIPQRLAIISSPSAAGYQDFMKELDGYVYRFDTELFEAVMQGHGAENSIIDALLRIAGREAEFDVVVIIRGGGSQSDLSFLNSYMLSSNIAQFPLPVVAGLGHDKDQSVVDMVAALSLKTPTAVASFFVDRLAAFDGRLDELGSVISNKAGNIIVRCDKRLNMIVALLRERSAGVALKLGVKIDALNDMVAMYAGRIIAANNQKANIAEGIMRERVGKLMTGENMRMTHLAALLASVDPNTVLARGYSIVRIGGKALTDSSQAETNAVIDITLYKGKLTAKITGDDK